jgi:uncharacterized protein
LDGRVFLPADQFVLKVHSRCDLACDHCYVYASVDQSWRGRPLTISPDVVSQTAVRIAEHVKRHDLSRVEVVLHGGEPLLAGMVGLRRILGELAAALRGRCQLELRVHTNGVLLTEELCELFDEYGVRVGISLDGDRPANDRHRRYRDGRSSYDQAIRAIGLLSGDRFRHLNAGLLCTIDVANDPVATYRSLLALSPPHIDFLLPHANWQSIPPRAGDAGGVAAAATPTEYADWLIAIFDRWQADGYPVRVRTFDSIIATLAGGESSTEALGLSPVRTVVIETDGSYELADSLKVAYAGAPATGLDVFRHSLDEVVEHPGMAARQRGLDGLCATCRQCPVVTSCGGGMYAHRYRPGSEFDNPSVYCADLLKLIEHVRAGLPHAAAPANQAKHVISENALAELAGGLGGPEAIGQLAEAQRSLRRAVLTAVYRAAIGAPAVPATVRDRMRAAWQVLALSDRDRPDALDRVLVHPYLRVWAVRCLERLQSADHPDARTAAGGGIGGTGLEADLGHLGSLAAAVAIRGHGRARVTAPVVAGAVHLPGLGRLALEPGPVTPPGAGPKPDAETTSAAHPAWAVLEVDEDRVLVRVGARGYLLPRPALLTGEPCPAEPCPAESGQPDGPAASWEPVRVLTAPGIRVALEDTDPYRDCHQWPAAPRLTDAEFARWQRAFTLAWQEIQANHPAYGPALAAGLTVLMPLSAPAPGQDVSAAARQAYGAIGAALPTAPATLALLLIHEFQHVKLGAVLDLFDLFDPADKRLYHAPWRADPRPLEGLLQGTYAHLAVCDFWRARALLGEHDQARAGQLYAHWRAHTAAAVDTLARSGSLTPLGLRFVDRMRSAISPDS